MRKILLPLLLLTIAIAACSPYGKKVKISDRTEVFLKGDNVTEAEARKLGNYVDSTWKNASNEKSFQLSKDKDEYIVKMVVDDKKVAADSSLNEAFVAMQFLLEEEVFKGSKMKLVITDNTFKDLKAFPSNRSTASASDSSNKASGGVAK